MSYHYLKVKTHILKRAVFLNLPKQQIKRMSLRYCIIILIITLSNASIFGQDMPLFTHYYANPYIYNPAYAGIEGRPIVSLTHRQQWVGIEDAPVTSNLTFHMPVIGGFSMGLNVTQDQYGIFSTSGGLLSFAYSVPLGFNQYVTFGLSGGAKYQNIDFSSGIDLSDPAIINIDPSTKLDGNAGLAYHIGGFSLGFALQNIFNTSTFPTDSFDPGTLGLIRNYMVTADYMLYFGNDEYIFQPYGSYRSFEGFSSQYEVGGIFHVKHMLWAGGSYRQHFGIIGMLGVKLKSAFSVAYAYEIPTDKAEGINKSSHEIHLNLAFGKKQDRAKNYTTFLASKKPTKPKKKKKAPKVEEPIAEDTTAVEEPDSTIVEQPSPSLLDSLNQGGNKIRLIISNEPPARTDEQIQAEKDSLEAIIPIELRPALVTTRGGHPFELNEGHYVIVGAFGVAANAIRMNDQLMAQGYDSDFGYSSDKKLFYVHIIVENSSEGARAKRDELRKISTFSRAWYLLVK